ncbi:MAG: aldehyde dehydrogenase family protein, partial [Cyanothece sp. SIO1E1]|nr:aldehyde dehydrogenase family protein [Cyanothece sp. SIO1E1]
HDGAGLHHGGKVEQIGGGYWCLPTVLTNVDHQMRVMTEETFGPVIPVMTFSTEEEAVALANDSIYGLSASVFSTNIDLAIAIAQQLEAGAISINDGSLTNRVFDAEKNSFKQSGINGSRMGDAGFLRFFRKKALLIQEGKPATMASFEEGAS